ncbi:MAG: hypothetical protein IKP96_03995 [Elusimicrobiaceae bacterium]|nr:hypothetical protein [Elusimicrobiaceae bacterium]
MNRGIFWGIILVCWVFIFINYIRKPQETKNNYSNFWFVLKSLWEKRKTSQTYKRVSRGWFIFIILSLFTRWAMIMATTQHNSALALISLILITTLPILALVLVIYSTYKIYQAGKESLVDKNKTLNQTKTPFAVYLYDFVYILLLLFPHYIRLVK